MRLALVQELFRSSSTCRMRNREDGLNECFLGAKVVVKCGAFLLLGFPGNLPKRRTVNAALGVQALGSQQEQARTVRKQL